MSSLPSEPAHLARPSNGPQGIDPPSSDVPIIAVMGVVFAMLGLSCLPFNLGAWVDYGWPLEAGGPGVIDKWCLVSTFIGLGLSALLLLSSLGCYRLATWGRDGMLLWAVLSLIYGVTGIFFWGRFFLPRLLNQYVEMRGPDEIAGLIAWIIGVGYAVIVLWYLTRPSVRMVFVGPGAASH